MLAFGEKEGAMVDICFLYLPGFSWFFFAGGEEYRKSHPSLLLYWLLQSFVGLPSTRYPRDRV